MITDGAANFHDAFKKEFFTINPRTRHISHIRLQGDHNNDKMERLNEAIKAILAIFFPISVLLPLVLKLSLLARGGASRSTSVHTYVVILGGFAGLRRRHFISLQRYS